MFISVPISDYHFEISNNAKNENCDLASLLSGYRFGMISFSSISLTLLACTIIVMIIELYNSIGPVIVSFLLEAIFIVERNCRKKTIYFIIQ